MTSLNLERVTCWGLFAAGFFVPVAIATISRLMLSPPSFGTIDEPGSKLPPPCDSTRLDNVCPEELVCVDGVCRDLQLETRCPIGESCPSSLCAPGLEHHAGLCAGPDEVNLAAWACRGDPQWERNVRDMQRRCGETLHEPGAPLTSCDATLWEAMNRGDESFERGLFELPGSFSVVFPEGEPKRPEWPPPTIRAYYQAALAEQRGALGRARVIFVIGRASMRSGTPEYNREVAGRRAELVDGLLRGMLGPDVQILHWSLASQLSLPPADFQRPGHPSPIGWDAATTQRLARELAADESSGVEGLDSDAWRELSDAVNRVVLVVPIGCDGTEFFPTPSFRGRGVSPEVEP